MADNVGTEGAAAEKYGDFKLYEPPKEEPKVEQPVENVQPEVVDEPVEVDQPDGEVEAQDDNDAADKPKKRKGGFQRREEKHLKYIAELEAKLAKEPEPPKPEKIADTEGKPKLEDFDNYEDYTEALTDWKLDQREKAKEQKSKQDALDRELSEKVENYTKLKTEAVKKYPDFEEALNEVDDPSHWVRHAILDSDNGPELAYYLAKNPDLYDKINKMGVVAVNREIGKIEALLSSKPSAAEVKASKAPQPITPVGQRKSGQKDPSKMPFEEFKAWRDAGGR